MLFRVRPILVSLRGEPRGSHTTSRGCFLWLLPLSAMFQFPRTQCFGPLTRKQGLCLAGSSMDFPQPHLRPGDNGDRHRGKGTGSCPPHSGPQLLQAEGRVPPWAQAPGSSHTTAWLRAEAAENGGKRKQNPQADFSALSMCSEPPL